MEVIRDDGLKAALKSPVRDLVYFLVDHLVEFADIALGVAETEFRPAQLKLLSLIVMPVQSFTKLFRANRLLLSGLND
jgi:hypothetical protein